MTQKSDEKLFTIPFFVIAFVNLCLSVVTQMFNSTFTLHMRAMSYPAALAGTVISSGAIAATIYRFFGGMLCEKFGRKKLILTGSLIFGVMSLMLGRVSTVPLFFVFRMLQMFGYSMGSTAVSVAIADVLPRKRLGEGLGYFGLATSISTAADPSAALALYDTSGGFAAVMLGALIACLFSFAVTASLLNYEKKWSGEEKADLKAEKKTGQYRGIQKYVEVKALPAAGINFFIIFDSCLITMFLMLFAKESGIAGAGLFFTISVVFMLAARIVSGKISDRYGVLRAFLPGVVFLVIAFSFLMMVGSSHYLYYVAGVFYGLGNGMATPALNAEAVRNSPRDRVSVASSTFFLPLDLAFVIGSVVWGILIDRLGFRQVFMIAIGIVATSAAAALLVFCRRISGAEREMPEAE